MIGNISKKAAKTSFVIPFTQIDWGDYYSDTDYLTYEELDFPRFSRQLIMSEITKRKLNERHQIYRRV